jgi:hypothetical protein
MPTYSFQNTTTGEVVDKILKIAEREVWLKDNPDWQQIHTKAPAMGDPVRLGVKRIDNGFREVLQKIHERAPGSTLKDSIR